LKELFLPLLLERTGVRLATSFAVTSHQWTLLINWMAHLRHFIHLFLQMELFPHYSQIEGYFSLSFWRGPGWGLLPLLQESHTNENCWLIWWHTCTILSTSSCKWNFFPTTVRLKELFLPLLLERAGVRLTTSFAVKSMQSLFRVNFVN
jgi:hypothetical protein